jgi:hypothetical protein
MTPMGVLRSIHSATHDKMIFKSKAASYPGWIPGGPCPHIPDQESRQDKQNRERKNLRKGCHLEFIQALIPLFFKYNYTASRDF